MSSNATLNRVAAIVLGGQRHLHANLLGYIDCREPNESYCIFQAEKARAVWPFTVTKYVHGKDAFTKVRTFKTLTEAWKVFVDTTELFCLIESADADVRPSRVKPIRQSRSHGRGTDE